MKETTKTILAKKGAEKIAMITAYDALFARFAAAAKMDMILVGDSVGNNILGYSSTIPVTLRDMIHHTAAVSRACGDSLLVADLPFAIAHYSFDKLLDACRALLQEGGAEAVKIEGDARMAGYVERLTDAGIAVMAHIGLRPQQYLRMGGYRKFGKTEEERKQLTCDAKALEKAGAFSILIEMTDHRAAAELTANVSVPTISCGSGPFCDGQVLVMTDVLGLSERAPKFAKRYANLAGDIVSAYSAYVSEVKSGIFPGEE